MPRTKHQQIQIRPKPKSTRTEKTWRKLKCQSLLQSTLNYKGILSGLDEREVQLIKNARPSYSVYPIFMPRTKHQQIQIRPKPKSTRTKKTRIKTKVPKFAAKFAQLQRYTFRARWEGWSTDKGTIFTYNKTVKKIVWDSKNIVYYVYHQKFHYFFSTENWIILNNFNNLLDLKHKSTFK